ncbi:unnamed protein product [Cyprideis torosa]|uniref:Uncharacterized protein n=1 Tax=Cyprideis torosa TaxID=163714 RepID=A0A7R8ZU38_9CRUS|nr:unnamed protein product [Cyprideis torosa]CAG0899624.1 unnamed protein product [Cyprideis torosa]
MKNVAFWNSGGVANTLKGLMLRPRLSQYLIAPTALRGAELAPDEFRAARCVPCKECFPRDDPTMPLGVAEFIGPNHRRHTEYVHEVWYCRDHDDAKSNVAKMAGRMSAASPSEPSPSPMQIACAANLAKLYMEQVRQQQEIQAKATEAMNAIRYAIATEEYHCNRPPQPPAKDQGLSPARQGSPGSLGPPRQGSPAAPLDGGPMVNGGPLGSPAGEEKDFVERRPGNEGETFVLGPTIPVQLAMTPGRVDQGGTKGVVPVILNNTGPKCVLPVVRGSRLHPPPPCPLCGAIPIPRSELDLILDDKKRKRHSSMPVRSQFSGSATATAGGCSKEASKRKKDRSKSRKESQIQKELVAELTRQLTRTPVMKVSVPADTTVAALKKQITAKLVSASLIPASPEPVFIVAKVFKSRFEDFPKNHCSVGGIYSSDLTFYEVLDPNLLGEETVEIRVIQRRLVPKEPTKCSYCRKSQEDLPGKLHLCTACYKAAYCDEFYH